MELPRKWNFVIVVVRHPNTQLASTLVVVYVVVNHSPIVIKVETSGNLTLALARALPHTGLACLAGTVQRKILSP
jgi:hypothetical protein